MSLYLTRMSTTRPLRGEATDHPDYDEAWRVSV